MLGKPHKYITHSCSQSFLWQLGRCLFQFMLETKLRAHLKISIIMTLIWRHCISMSHGYVTFIEINKQASSFVTSCIFLSSFSLVNTSSSHRCVPFTKYQLCCAFFVVNINNLLKQQLSCRALKRPWLFHDITATYYICVSSLLYYWKQIVYENFCDWMVNHQSTQQWILPTNKNAER